MRIILILMLYLYVCLYCSGDSTNDVVTVTPPAPILIIGASQIQALHDAMIGTWSAKIGKETVEISFEKDGKFTAPIGSGTFVVGNNMITINNTDGTLAYQVDIQPEDLITPSILTLSGGDLPQAIKFISARSEKLTRFSLKELFQFSPRAFYAKLRRILTIFLIVLMSRVIISGFRYLSRFIIYSQFGPMKFIYPSRKNRTMTIHSLVLNIAKYVVYFGALGRILNELGVNYTAYFASLSVVGLAIGFGSQGLVQDIVTGFFVIFESQFDVGDMVEISGQTGVVEELGLRMTRLRNYFGQTFTIPNRNIVLVGTYSRGLLNTCIDIAVKDEASAMQAVPIIEKLGKEIARQYKGIFILEPKVTGPLSLESGEYFLRVNTGLWPQQQWAVEQQFIPRVREVLKQQGIDIPNDRVSVFYHTPLEKKYSARRKRV